MELRRTANAGVLLKLDGVTILMDGVCREVKPYPATPPEVKEELKSNMPDVIAFTHAHKDHYDPGFAADVLRQNGVILGPEGVHGTMVPMMVGPVRIAPIASRHIGVAGKDTPHASFIIEGSTCIWFTGDAAPSQWSRMEMPVPDVLIVPYAYCNTPSAWRSVKQLKPKAVVLLHMPEREADIMGLWHAVESTVGEDPILYIPAMNEQLQIQVPRH